MTVAELNYCPSCDTDFSSVAAFDAHRVGVHAYTYSEGVAMDPIREDGRRCLNRGEFEEAGLRPDKNGRWQLWEQAEKARLHFAGR